MQQKCGNNSPENGLKKMFIPGLLMLILVFFILSCKNRGGEGKSNETTLKKIENERFHFSFSIPKSWSAVEMSDNGDGFFVFSDLPGEIRIYGEAITEDTREPLFDCKTEETFTFSDRAEGKLCRVSPGEWFIYRSDSNTRIVFYYKADHPVKLSDTLLLVARNIRFSEKE